ncbi:glycosyltransferase [Alteribacter natronophilus]|nr:glycosyltransferase [Alteribacter natronophilus]
MKKIKVMFFIYQMGAGGAARTLLNIINNLDRERFVPVLVTLDFDGSYESELKDDVKLIKLNTQRLSRSVFRLARVIRQEKADLVFSTIPRVNTIAILAGMLSFSKARNIVREADNLSGGLKTSLQLKAFGLAYKCAGQVVSLSEGVKENLVKRYGLKSENIKVVYNPIDIKAINRKLESGIPAEHKEIFDTDEKVIVTAGRLVKQKDQATLIRAFAKAREQVACRLVILGEGELESSLKEQAVTAGAGESVHFIGFQRNPYVYFREADVFALSSLHEGFSHVIAEALACGTPVISTNCKSGPEEVLDFGKYGYLCNVGDADRMAEYMVKVLTLPQEEKEYLAEQGLERAAFFDAGKMVAQYEKIMLETCSK